MLHSIGSKYYNKKVGSCKWSDICVLVFISKDNYNCEGGCITTNNKEYFEK